MNKLFTLALLGLSALSLQAANTDHITPQALKDQVADLKCTATTNSYNKPENTNAEVRFTGESGASYYFKDMSTDGDLFWMPCWSGASAGYMVSIDSPGYIEEIRVVAPSSFDYKPSQFDFKVSTVPFATEDGDGNVTVDKWLDGVAYITLYNDGNGVYEWKADGLYKYLLLDTSQEYIADLQITYAEEAPKVAVKDPVVSCWDPVPGNSVYIDTETEDATLNIEVYVNGDPVEEITYEGSHWSGQLAGQPGDDVTYVVKASKEGYADSAEVQETITVQTPVCPRYQSEYGDVWPGKEITFTHELDGAKLTYKTGYMNWDDNSLNWSDSQYTTATFPVTITVPANVYPGGSFYITAYASAEGYKNSQESDNYFQVISTVLDAPGVNIESGKEVQKGSVLTISRNSSYATTIHYVLNDEAEVKSTEWSVEIPLNDDCTIKTWLSGDAPFTDSEVLTLTYTVEKFNDFTDAIYPTSFCAYDPDYYKGSTQFDFDYTSDVTGASYHYYGGLWYQERFDTNVFYLQKGTAFYNTTAEPKDIKQIKITSDLYSGTSCYILYSATPLTGANIIEDWETSEARVRVGETSQDFNYDEWITPAAILEKKGFDVSEMPYFLIYRFGSTVISIPRFVVEYVDPETVVSEITAVDSEEVIFNLNGVRVASENLAPGIYIRKAGGKTEKFIVK